MQLKSCIITFHFAFCEQKTKDNAPIAMGFSVVTITVRQRFRGSARSANHYTGFLLLSSEPGGEFTCGFVLHGHVKGDPAGGPCVGWGALVLRQGSAAEGVEHHCPLVS